MTAAFWVKRFLLAFVVASISLGAVQYLKGSTLPSATQFGLLWGAISAALFTLVGYIRYKRNPACMLRRSKH